MTQEIFLARQPILDADRRTFGYELLYRDGPQNEVNFDDPDRATQSVIERAMLDWGMERIIGDRFGFINAGPQLILNGLHRALPPEGIIIELREDEPFDTATIEALRAARRDGYHFALDNVTSLAALRRSTAIGHVSMVKVQMPLPREELIAIAQHVRSVCSGVLLVAEKVETTDEYTLCCEASYDLFQGYYFARPEVLNRAARPSNATSTLALLAEIQQPDIDIDRVEELVGSDPSLAYRLLAVVNSSAFGLDRRVESLRHSIVLLGLTQVRHLATLLAMSASSSGNEALIGIGATRAHLARALATTELRSAAFTVGLLSVTEALYHTPMEELLQSLPVSDQIREALLGGDGELGRLLLIAQACENADVDQIDELAPGRINDVREAYADAAEWSDALRGQMATARSRVVLPGVAA